MLRVIVWVRHGVVAAQGLQNAMTRFLLRMFRVVGATCLVRSGVCVWMIFGKMNGPSGGDSDKMKERS